MARIHAREAALKVATDGLRWAIGAGQTDPQPGELRLSLPAIYAAQAGLIEDMDLRRCGRSTRPSRPMTRDRET